MSLATDQRTGAVGGAATTVALCFLVAMLEGFDIQAMGVAAPKLGGDLHLGKAALGQALSASNIGLVLGASAGGWLADRVGRKPVLIAAVLAFGAFTLMTTAASGLAVLFAVRLGAGVGFGAALPNLMAMAAEVSRPERRGSTGSAMFCGMPVGGGIVALISWLTPHEDWRVLFVIGGLAPLAIAPALIALMAETHRERRADATGISPWLALAFAPLYGACYLAVRLVSAATGATAFTALAGWLAAVAAVIVSYVYIHRAALFSAGRAGASLLVWAVFAPTLLILYLVLNWLPTLVAAKGFAADAAQASVWFNFAGVLGALALGRVVDRFGVRWPLMLAYAGLIAALLALAQAQSLPAILVLSGAAGACLLGANYAFYGAAATFYPEAVRGRGSGAAVAWGRLGSVFGPLAGGYLLAQGASAASVVQAMVPFAAIAGAGVILLSYIGAPAD